MVKEEIKLHHFDIMFDGQTFSSRLVVKMIDNPSLQGGKQIRAIVEIADGEDAIGSTRWAELETFCMVNDIFLACVWEQVSNVILRVFLTGDKLEDILKA